MSGEAGANEPRSLPILDEGRLAPPCRSACPADMDIPGFLRAIAHGDHAAAWRIIYHDNLFPSVLGWICPRPCEGACRLGAGGAPVPVCQIKRWVTASHAPPEDLAREPAAAGPAVAVIGAGPAGLAAAHDLALAGMHVTVFDRHSQPGGLLTTCIPTFRLPTWVAEGDIERVLSLGITFEPGFTLRERADVEHLLQARGFAAVLIAAGPGDDREPDIPGWRRSEASRTAIEFLREARDGRMRLKGRRVIVVGGGNGAIDAARTALRAGALDVRILYRRERRDMPAFPEEIEIAEDEGVRILPRMVVTMLTWDGDKLHGVQCERTRSTGGGGRGAVFELAPGSEHVRPCDIIIFAIGQTPTVTDDLSGLENVFTCGHTPDAVGTVVTAIASGRRAAARVLRALPSGERTMGTVTGASDQDPRTAVPNDHAGNVTPPHHAGAAAHANGTSHPCECAPGDLAREETECGGASEHGDPAADLAALRDLLDPRIAAAAARRCLACDHVLALDPDACILCGQCAVVCAFDALTWRLAEEGSRPVWRLWIHDAECQRCGDCVVVCPAGALDWRPWTLPNRSYGSRSIEVASPDDDSSS